MSVVTLALPFFGLILLGYVVGRLTGLGPAGLAGLNVFVIYVALPALFFQIIGATPLAELANWSFVLTASFSTYCAFAIAFSAGALINQGNVPEATIQGLAGAYGNIGYMAPGLALAAFGPAAAVPTALIFCFDNAMLFALAPLMMALGGTDRAGPGAMALLVARRVFLHPFILATLAGVASAASGLHPTGALDRLLDLLQAAAAPCALFAMGATIAMRRVRTVPVELPVMVATKLVVHPAIVYVLLSWVGDFPPVWMYTAVLIAALPTAANVFVLAQQYRVYTEGASTAILASTIVSVFTVTGLLALIGSGRLPPDLFP